MAKLLGGAGLLVATALIGGTLISGALAAPDADPSSTAVDGHGPFGFGGQYCDVFMDTFASELGVSRDDLLPASKAAAVAAVDAAAEAGDLDEDSAANLRERIEGLDETGCEMGMGLGLGFGRGLAMGAAHGFMHADVLDSAANALGLEPDELIDRFSDGSSLQEIAEAEGVDYDDVKSAVVAAVQSDLDAAMADGLDQERADSTLERLQAWLDDGGAQGFGRIGGMGFGRGHAGGPWH
jgi:hypothetical protein